MKYFKMIDALYLHSKAAAGVVTELLTAVIHILPKGGIADCNHS